MEGHGEALAEAEAAGIAANDVLGEREGAWLGRRSFRPIWPRAIRPPTAASRRRGKSRARHEAEAEKAGGRA
jgi:hypothetical protein